MQSLFFSRCTLICLTLLTTGLSSAWESTRDYECALSEEDDYYLSVSGRDELEFSSEKDSVDISKCTVSIRRLHDAGILSSWNMLDLRSRQQFSLEHIKGAMHNYLGTLRGNKGTSNKELIYLPQEEASFGTVCKKIISKELGAVRIILEDKSELLSMGIKFSSGNPIKREFSYLNSSEFIPKLINEQWYIYDLTNTPKESEQKLGGYGAAYQYVNIKNGSLKKVKDILNTVHPTRVAFLVNSDLMNSILATKEKVFKSAWYVNTSDTSITAELEKSARILTYKLTPKPLPKCYLE